MVSTGISVVQKRIGGIIGAVLSDIQKGNGTIKTIFKFFIESPIALTFSIIFAPFILLLSLFKSLKDISRHGTFIDVARSFVIICGLVVSIILIEFAGTFVGKMFTVLISQGLFGFTLSIFVTFIMTIFFQWLVFSVSCFVFLKLSNKRVIEIIIKEHIDEDYELDRKTTNHKDSEEVCIARDVIDKEHIDVEYESNRKTIDQQDSVKMSIAADKSIEAKYDKIENVIIKLIFFLPKTIILYFLRFLSKLGTVLNIKN
jgi:hypothetical protein